MRPLHCRFRIEDAGIGEDRHRNAPDAGKAGDQRGAVELLELIEVGPIDQARDHLAHVVALREGGRDDAVDLGRVKGRRARGRDLDIGRLHPVEAGDDGAHDGECVLVVERIVIDHPRLAGMHVGSAQIFGAHHLAGRRLHQRRSGEEWCPGA